MLVHEWQDDIVFLHKIAPGSADKSYGIHVAQLAGVPAEVLDRACAVLAELERTTWQPRSASRQPPAASSCSEPVRQQRGPHPARIRTFDIGKQKPEEIAAQVRRWQRELRNQ